MSRGRLRSGGAGKGRTKKNAGPETTWEPEPLAESSTNEPEPLFPVYQPHRNQLESGPSSFYGRISYNLFR